MLRDLPAHEMMGTVCRHGSYDNTPPDVWRADVVDPRRRLPNHRSQSRDQLDQSKIRIAARSVRDGRSVPGDPRLNSGAQGDKERYQVRSSSSVRIQACGWCLKPMRG